MKPKTAEKSDSTHPKRQNESTRERVLKAAFTLFCEHGFSDVNMLEIATRAQVSKRDLYGVTGQFVRNCTLTKGARALHRRPEVVVISDFAGRNRGASCSRGSS